MADQETAEPDGSVAESELAEHVGKHESPDGAPLNPLIDLSRDPTPGKADHARPDDD
ncbi:MAG: hypothetical protein QOI50_6978 [Pseudonocardiales bacterium]|jgi:hypothetical protein|nr:hypothetical protein [Pseudonocardiales bacterium]